MSEIDNVMLPPSAFVAHDQSMPNDINSKNNTIKCTSHIITSSCDLESQEKFQFLQKALHIANHELSKTIEEKKSILSQLLALKAYFGNSDMMKDTMLNTTSSISKKSFFPEFKSFKDVCIQNEKDLLEEERSLMQIQLSSLEKVLRLQEKEISASLTASRVKTVVNVSIEPSKVTHKGVNREESIISVGDRLLNAWRQQVVRLLVQRLVQEEAASHDKARFYREIAKLISEKRSSEIKEKSFVLKLEASSAALDAATKKNEIISLQLGKIMSELEATKAKNQREAVCVAETLKSLQKKMSMLSVVAEAIFVGGPNYSPSIMDRICVLERRLEFASTRLPLLRSLLLCAPGCRKQALLNQKHKSDRSDCGVQVDFIHDSLISEACLQGNTESIAELVFATQEECRKAHHERDILAKRLEKYALSYEEYTESFKNNYENKLSQLTEKLNYTESLRIENGLSLDILNKKYQALQLECTRGMEITAMEKAELQSELVQARNDLAKAVIASRKAKLITAPERDEINKSEIEGYHKGEIESLTKNLNNANQKLLLAPPQLHTPAYLPPRLPRNIPVLSLDQTFVLNEKEDIASKEVLEAPQSNICDNLDTMNQPVLDDIVFKREAISVLDDLAKLLKEDGDVECEHLMETK